MTEIVIDSSADYSPAEQAKWWTQRRWHMAFLLFSGLVVVYTLRVNMSVAAQKMRDELQWSESDKGYVLSSFYWGYMVGQIPASLIAQNYGAKWLYGLSVAIPSFLTILVPMACRTSFPLALFIRVVIGFFESASFPALYHMFPIWVPLSEKTLMIPAIVSGMYMGEMVGFSLSGILAESRIVLNGIDYGGWPSIFYVFGLLGLVWFPFWAVYAFESPAEHPSISIAELELMGKDAMFNMEASILSNDVETSNCCIEELEMGPVSKSVFVIDMDEGDEDFTTDKKTIIADGDEDGSSSNSSDSEPFRYMASSVEMVSTNDQKSVNSSSMRRFVEKSSSDITRIARKKQGYDHFPNSNNETSHHDSNETKRKIERSEIEINKRQNELQQQQQQIQREKRALAQRTPWILFLSHPMAVTLLFCNFQFGWMNFTLMSEMPSFLTDILGFDLRKAGILCVIPYLAMFFSSSYFGKLYNYLQHHHSWTVNTIRRHAQFVAYFCSGCCLITCTFITSAYPAFSFMILTLIFFGANQSGMGCAYTDIAPNFSSAFNTIGNTMGALAGIIGPIFVAACVKAWPGIIGWRVAFFSTFTVSCATLIVWFRFVRAEIHPLLNKPIDMINKNEGSSG